MARTLMLRTFSKDMTSYGGFQWPKKVGALVKAPDWNPKPECGGGLHGLLRGCGDGSLLNWSPEAIWGACWIEESEAVDLGGKVKVPRCEIACLGDRKTVTDFLLANGCAGFPVVGAFVTAGDGGTATAGDWGTATAGDWGTATAGYGGTATAGDRGTATAGDEGTATAGDRGTATAGDEGTATAGYEGTATAGYVGTATAGDRGTATAGDEGAATAGYEGTATAGHGGEIRIRWHDGNHYRLAVGYVGEDGIRPNVPYVVKDGKLVEKTEANQEG